MLLINAAQCEARHYIGRVENEDGDAKHDKLKKEKGKEKSSREGSQGDSEFVTQRKPRGVSGNSPSSLRCLCPLGCRAQSRPGANPRQ